jgi:para-nitrobenzyl esterase
MVWVHGGFNQFGSASEAQFNGTLMANNHNVIVVAMEYRLGAFGTLVSHEIAEENPDFPTNGGMNYLLDQMQALKWVKAHITMFGGNPDQVTLFGESAGGLSVCNHLASPLSKGLFKRAIIQSGPCNGPWGANDPKVGKAWSQHCMGAMNCTNLACLRKVPWQKLILEWCTLYFTQDGLVLPTTAASVFAAGNFSLPSGSNVLLGYTSGDSLLGPPYWMGRPWWRWSKSTYQTRIRKYFPHNGKDILRHYPFTGSSTNWKNMVLLNSDVCMKCPLETLAQQLNSRKGVGNVYLYDYAYDPLRDVKLPDLSNSTFNFHNIASHDSEVSSVFGNTGPCNNYSFWNERKSVSVRHGRAQHRVTVCGAKGDYPVDLAISNTMRTYWTNFAKTGNPMLPSTAGLHLWPPFRSGHYESQDPNKAHRDEYMLFTSKVAKHRLPSEHLLRCALWGDSVSGIVNNQDAYDFCIPTLDLSH